MENFSSERVTTIVRQQRAYFATGATLEYRFRQMQLQRLGKALQKWEKSLSDALWTDLHKSYEEAYITEFSLVEGEIKNHLSHLSSWMKPRRCKTPIKLFPSRSRVISEPLGSALIVSPWNYPVQLLLNPLVGAISAGCTAVLKPSPYVPHVSQVIEQMICETFNESYIAVVQGNREVNQQLFNQRFDIIFFTGSPALGKKVMEAASHHLTPVVLELGGKSPCIVDQGANLKVAAKRIAWGKTLNAGQTCIAPDYLLIHHSLKEQFVQAFKESIQALHGSNVRQSKHYVRMVNDRAFLRVSNYLKEGRVLLGGSTDASERYIEPTLLDQVSLDSPVMQEEIFGPILPMITFEDIHEVENFITNREKPLAFYYFGTTPQGMQLLNNTTSGGACLNDTIMHIVNENMPFGGVGNSGMGHYHGRDSYEAFSHQRSVVITPTLIDLPFRYMPYKHFGLVKKIM